MLGISSWMSKKIMSQASTQIKNFNILPQQYSPDLCTKMEMLDGRRIYTTNTGLHFPSITTILSNTMTDEKKNMLKDWQERVGMEEADQIKNDAADRGTSLHNIMEKYVLGEDYSTDLAASSKLVQRMFKQFIPVLEKMDNIRLVEKPLYSSGLRVAGKVDLIAEWHGSLATIDFKTSTKRKTIDQIGDYLLQETFYSVCYAEHFSEKIDKIITVIGTQESLKAHVFVETPKKHLTSLIKRVQQYYKENGNETSN